MNLSSLLREDELSPPTTSPWSDDFGIAIVGCGLVATEVHLPAYRDHGYRVVHVCDREPDRARLAAERFGVARWSTDVDAVLDDPAVHIVDLAVQADDRPELVTRIALAGRHILAQKPLATSFVEALRAVEQCEAFGVTLMVNQQARWAPSHQALRRLVDEGVLGELYSALHVYRDFQDFENSWFVTMPHATTLDHGVHYFDLARFLPGREPRRVKAAMATLADQRAVTPMIYSALCEYDDHLMATLHFNNIVRARPSHRYEWCLDGTAGSARATLTDLSFTSATADADPFVVPFGGRWYNDAFASAMGELLDSVALGREPQTSGRDHLRSLGLALAAIESANQGLAVEVDPFVGQS